MVEGRRVSHRGLNSTDLSVHNGSEVVDDRLDSETTVFLDDLGQERNNKLPGPQRSKLDTVPPRTQQTSSGVPVSLPMLYIEGKMYYYITYQQMNTAYTSRITIALPCRSWVFPPTPIQEYKPTR